MTDLKDLYAEFPVPTKCKSPFTRRVLFNKSCDEWIISCGCAPTKDLARSLVYESVRNARQRTYTSSYLSEKLRTHERYFWLLSNWELSILAPEVVQHD